MNSLSYPVQNYVPTKVKPRTSYDTLDDTLKRMTFNEITSNPDYHFKHSYITNFDLIHNNCRGDKLQHSKKYYETISYEKLNKELILKEDRKYFISSAIKSERKDVFIEKEIFQEHFNREEIEKNLKKQKKIFIFYEEKCFS